MKEKNWDSRSGSFSDISLTGEKIKLDVPFHTHTKRKTEFVFADDVIKSEQKYYTGKYGLKPTQLHDLLLIFADSRYFEGKRVVEKTYRFNKMLFYVWKEMEKTEFASSYEHDEFGAARAGPVPKKLKESLHALEKAGLIYAKWSHKPNISSRFELTERGEAVAQELWNTVPDNVKLIYKKVKQDIALLGAEELKHKVHKEYPEYKKNYTEPDNEE